MIFHGDAPMLLKSYRMALTLFTCAFCLALKLNATSPNDFLPCIEQADKQTARSQELKELVDADQTERVDFEFKTEEERATLFNNDLVRRKRVGEILGEGCFKTAEDYAAASLIYQHGDSSDHYFQAFIWALRAVQLGYTQQKPLVAMTIDRYLISLGKKQLFGSQAYASDLTGWCYCLEKVELSFPDSFRKEYSGHSLEERYAWLTSINQGKACSDIECPVPRKPSPRGTVPGFW